MLLVRAFGRELRPADGNATADGLATAILSLGGDKEIFRAVRRCPRGDVGSVDVDNGGRARWERELHRRQAVELDFLDGPHIVGSDAAGPRPLP